MTTCTGSTTGTKNLDELVRSHLPLVGHLVRELLSRVPAHVSREDLLSAGMAAPAGPPRAVGPDPRTPLRAFPPTPVRGALPVELRCLDWASRPVLGRAPR